MRKTVPAMGRDGSSKALGGSGGRGSRKGQGKPGQTKAQRVEEEDSLSSYGPFRNTRREDHLEVQQGNPEALVAASIALGQARGRE